MKKLFVHQIGFRVLIPILEGIMAYILVLLTFSTLKNLFVNIISIEAMLCILIAGLNNEAVRIWILLFQKHILKSKNPAKLIVGQISVSLMGSVLLTSAIVYFYYVYLVGFNRFGTELLVFNSIFLVFVILLQTIYFSILYLDFSAALEIKQADSLKELAESELEAYKLKMNPPLLYKCLETLITLVRVNPEKASDFVQKLSDVYRVLLTIKPMQVCSLKKEIEAAENFCYLYNQRFGNLISISVPEKDTENIVVLQGSIFGLLYILANSNIITFYCPLQINVTVQHETIVVQSNHTPKLAGGGQDKMLEYIKKSHFQLTGHEMDVEIDKASNQIRFVLKTVHLSH